MKILKIDYSFNYKSLDIYVAGCKGKPHCEGCHNPSSWDFDQGIELKEAYFIMDRYISEADCMIDNIMLFGGEWLDQDLDVVESFLKNIKKEYGYLPDLISYLFMVLLKTIVIILKQEDINQN